MGEFNDYYEYEVALARGILVPFLEGHGVALNGGRVLDVGCGAGGFLNVLAERFGVQGVGLDYDREMLAKCPPAVGVTLVQADFLGWDSPDRFNLILLRDVLEHCDRPAEMLARAAALLAPDGALYVTYSPYYSPFGGHQHNGRGFFSRVPYVQVLPEAIFLRLIRPRGNFYKSADYLTEDLKRICRAKLTTGAVKGICRRLGLTIKHRRVFAVRPDYWYKFGLPAIALPAFLPLSSMLDPFCTSVELLLARRVDEGGTAHLRD